MTIFIYLISENPIYLQGIGQKLHLKAIGLKFCRNFVEILSRNYFLREVNPKF